jgi:capsular polysaccharide biosynthesis protein
VTVPDVYRALWRHKLMIVALTAALGAAVWFYTSRQPRVYQAAVLVRVQPNVKTATDAYRALQTGQGLAETYARLTATTSVAREIQKQLKGEIKLNQIKISAKQVRTLDLITITARNRSRARAQQIANVAPKALFAFLQRGGTAGDHLIVVEPATLPRSPISPKPKLNVALAVILGLIFNGTLALLLHRLADPVGGPEELERLTGKPVLAEVPLLQLAPTGQKGDRAAHDERSPEQLELKSSEGLS